jgi:aryl-alcohol dehydrogenase-like predicted oxidoreductase
VSRALDLGVTYFDTARLYPESEVYLGQSLGPRRQRTFLATKTHARDKAGALAHLDESLLRLRTDYVDLWQLHDVRTDDELSQIFRPGGAIEALHVARQAGKARFLGVTGHRAPEVIQQCLNRFEFDVVMVPVNPAEPHHRSFLDSVIPLARAQSVGLVAMYPFCGGRLAKLSPFDTVEPFLRFALSQDISVALVGCDSLDQLDANVCYAERFVAMSSEEQEQIVELVAPDALSLMYYKG